MSNIGEGGGQGATLRSELAKETLMGLDDKISNKTEDLGGKAKEAVGSATGDRDLEAEGKGDQTSAAFKDGAEKVKDAASNIKDKLTGK